MKFLIFAFIAQIGAFVESKKMGVTYNGMQANPSFVETYICKMTPAYLATKCSVACLEWSEVDV